MRILTTQKMLDDLIELRKKSSLYNTNPSGYTKWVDKTYNNIECDTLLDYIIEGKNKLPKDLEPFLIELFNFIMS